MMTQRFMADVNMIQMLNVVVENFERQGVICEVSSPSEISFSSTLPQSAVKEILAGSSIPLKPSFAEANSGCRGTAKVQGLPRADE